MSASSVRTRAQTTGVVFVGGNTWFPNRDALAYFCESILPKIRAGGGTRLKILAAWAMGKAIVSTSVGCEGLHVVEGENMLVRDTPEGFADAVRRVLEDAELRRRLGEHGRRTVERHYSWEVVGERMIDGYLALARSQGAGHAVVDARSPRV